MTIKNYQTGAEIGSAEIDEVKYTHFCGSDHSGTGAVKAGEWLTSKQLTDLGIAAELTVYFE